MHLFNKSKTVCILLFSLLVSPLLYGQTVEESTALIPYLKVQEYVKKKAISCTQEKADLASPSRLDLVFFEIAFIEGSDFIIQEGCGSIRQEINKNIFHLEYDTGELELMITWQGEQQNSTCKIKEGKHWMEVSTLKSSLLINQIPSSGKASLVEGTLDFSGIHSNENKRIRILLNFFFDRSL